MSHAAITIFHNPACGTSRNALALIRNSGVEPVIDGPLERTGRRVAP
jgi:arsenate reductase (glutaredoxin)